VVEFVMSNNIQPRGIEEAEAQSVRQFALIQPSGSRPFAGAASRAADAGWFDPLVALARRAGRTAMRWLSPASTLRLPEDVVGDAGEISAEADADRMLVAILITDIVESTVWVARLGDYSWRELLDRHNDATRRQIRRFGGREIRTCGDGFLAIFDSATRAVRCALAIAEAVAPLGICLRGGVHTGEILLKGNEISGIAAHIAARIAAIARPCEVVVSSTVRDLAAGSLLSFENRGAHRLRGLPEATHLYSMPLAGNVSDRIEIFSQAALLGSRAMLAFPPGRDGSAGQLCDGEVGRGDEHLRRGIRRAHRGQHRRAPGAQGAERRRLH
jgi:class 3 adenylate cyclase